MSVTWLQPFAWWGLLALAAPVAIHLLTRQRSRAVPFPSLRFLQVTQLAAFRRRLLSDVPLLVVRLLVLTAAVAAVAAPVFVTPSRARSWQGRTARAIVEMQPAGTAVAGDRAAALIADERATAFVSWTGVATGRAVDVVTSAIEWLDRQPPAARELVIVGDLRAGLLTEADLAGVPTHIGIRILPLAEATPMRALTIPVTAPSGAELDAGQTLLVTLEDGVTRVARGAPSAVAPDLLTVIAAASEQAMAHALRAAVLADGLILPPDADRRVIVELRGAPEAPVVSPPADMWMRRVLESTPGGRGGERDGALVVRLDVAASDPLAVHQIAAVARAACADSLADREPRRIAPATLARWSRRPGPVPDAPAPADEGDGRWLWLAVLVLLAVEHLMRRRGAAAQAAVGRVEGEVRVA